MIFSFHLDHAASLPYVIMKVYLSLELLLTVDRLPRESVHDTSNKNDLQIPVVGLHQSFVGDPVSLNLTLEQSIPKINYTTPKILPLLWTE